MARAIKQGQHIFIAFQDGEAVLDSQLRPRMYKSREQFEKSFPVWRDGKAELVEYAPTLTPPNEPLTLEELREMEQSTPVWWDYIPCWVLVRRGSVLVFGSEPHKVENLFGYFYRRPPEGEEDT